jgi:bacterioferritin B
MLISEPMRAALNQQIGNEFGASLQYIAIAAHFDHESLPELAAYFFRQAEEERNHALRFVRYIIDAGGRVEIPTIVAPQNVFKTAAEAVELALDHEVMVTKQINALVELAVQEKDHITENTLRWFVTEQLEEVHSAQMLLRVVQRASEEGILQVEDYLVRHKARRPSSETDNGL